MSEETDSPLQRQEAEPSARDAASGVDGGPLISWGWGLALGCYYLATTTVMHLHKPAGVAALVAGLLLFRRPLGRLLRRTLGASWLQIDEEATAARAAETRRSSFDIKPLVVLCTVALSLTLIEYYGDRDIYERIARRFLHFLDGHRYRELGGFVYWSLARCTAYILLPLLVVRLLLPRERFRDYGLRVAGMGRHLWIYGALLLIVLPPVVMVSFTESFQRTYPFYKLAARSWGDFLSWQALYALQFFALEVFFRGFILHPLKERLGAQAIFVMIVPYCMIHYGKPVPEALGAIVAGIVLGTLSLRTGSIWCGVLIHVSVAVAMDGLALYHVAGFPGNSRLIF